VPDKGFEFDSTGESVFAARGIRDALSQAESLRATEITAITRQD
jgi:hypothetical protein